MFLVVVYKKVKMPFFNSGAQNIQLANAKPRILLSENIVEFVAPRRKNAWCKWERKRSMMVQKFGDVAKPS